MPAPVAGHGEERDAVATAGRLQGGGAGGREGGRMTWNTAVSIAATARAMAFSDVRIQRIKEGWAVAYRSWLGVHVVTQNSPVWNRRKKYR